MVKLTVSLRVVSRGRVSKFLGHWFRLRIYDAANEAYGWHSVDFESEYLHLN